MINGRKKVANKCQSHAKKIRPLGATFIPSYLIKLYSYDYQDYLLSVLSLRVSGVDWPGEHKVLVARLVAIGSITVKFREMVGHVSISDLKSILYFE